MTGVARTESEDSAHVLDETRIREQFPILT